MAELVHVPPELRNKVRDIIDAEGIPLTIAPAETDACGIRVAVSEGRCESTMEVLQAGGWIKCATAWALAARHGIGLPQLGVLLNALDIKVRQCSLGCFR